RAWHGLQRRSLGSLFEVMMVKWYPPAVFIATSAGGKWSSLATDKSEQFLRIFECGALLGVIAGAREAGNCSTRTDGIERFELGLKDLVAVAAEAVCQQR